MNLDFIAAKFNGVGVTIHFERINILEPRKTKYHIMIINMNPVDVEACILTLDHDVFIKGIGHKGVTTTRHVMHKVGMRRSDKPKVSSNRRENEVEGRP